MTARTAYGLDAPRGTHWTSSAACHSPDVDPDAWWPAEHSAPTATTRLAVHICRQHCPVRVRQQCDLDTRKDPPTHPVVLGGEYYGRQGGRVRLLPLTVSDTYADCPYCAADQPMHPANSPQN